MVEDERNKLLKSIDTKIGAMKDLFNGLKEKGTDVSDLQKSLDTLETQLGEYEDQNELVKSLQVDKTDLEKKLGDSEDKVKELQKTVDAVNNATAKKEHDDLIVKALDLVKSLDAETEIKDEDSYMEVLSKSFSEEDIKEDVDSCIKTDIKAMELAKTHIPAGDVPGQGNDDPEDDIDEDAQRAAELRKKLKEEGFLRGDE